MTGWRKAAQYAHDLPSSGYCYLKSDKDELKKQSHVAQADAAGYISFRLRNMTPVQKKVFLKVQ